MALTAAVKEELTHHAVRSSSERKAEVSAILRFAGTAHHHRGHRHRAELEQRAAARRLRTAVAEVY